MSSNQATKRKRQEDINRVSKEEWQQDLITKENVYIQEINSRYLVSLEGLCEYLDIKYTPKPRANGSWNDTYFTNINNDIEKLIAIRVSKTPIAVYSVYGNSEDDKLSFKGVNISRAKYKQIIIEAEKLGVGLRPVEQSLYSRFFHSKKHKDLLTQEDVENAEFIKQLAISKQNWIESSKKGLCPPLIYYGYVVENKPIGGLSSGYKVEIRSCIVSQRYSTDLREFYIKVVMTDIYDEREKMLINDKIFEKVKKMISGLVDLSIICADIKPENIVVKYNIKKGDEKVNINSIDVKLIDLDSDWCTRMTNGIVYNPLQINGKRISKRLIKHSHKEKIELLMLVFLGFHFIYYIQYNPFKSHFQRILTDDKKVELNNMLIQPTTISLEDVNENTDLDLLPFNETYKHYFLEKGYDFSLLADNLTTSDYLNYSRSSNSRSSNSRSSRITSSRSSSITIGGKKQKNNRKTVKRRK